MKVWGRVLGASRFVGYMLKSHLLKAGGLYKSFVNGVKN